MYTWDYPHMAPQISGLRCEVTNYTKAHEVSSADADNISATTEKTKGLLPIGKNPYIKIAKIFR